MGDDGAHLPDDRLPPVAERTQDTLRDRKAAADGWSQARRTIDTLKRSETIAGDQLAAREVALAACQRVNPHRQPATLASSYTISRDTTAGQENRRLCGVANMGEPVDIVR